MDSSHPDQKAPGFKTDCMPHADSLSHSGLISSVLCGSPRQVYGSRKRMEARSFKMNMYCVGCVVLFLGTLRLATSDEQGLSSGFCSFSRVKGHVVGVPSRVRRVHAAVKPHYKVLYQDDGLGLRHGGCFCIPRVVNAAHRCISEVGGTLESNCRCQMEFFIFLSANTIHCLWRNWIRLLTDLLLIMAHAV